MPNIKALVKTILICIAVYILFRLGLSILSPLILAVFICIVIEPIIKVMMERLHMGRVISIAAALLFLCILLFIIAFILVQSLYKESMTILKDTPLYYEKIRKLVINFLSFIMHNLNIPLDGQNITELSPERMLGSLVNIFTGLKDIILKIVYSLPDILMYTSFSLIAAFFISRDKMKIMKAIKGLLPDSVINVVYKINRTITKVIKTEFILIGISTIQTVVGLLILNVSYAVIIGIISGILDLLPVVGQGIIFIPWIIYSFINGNAPFGISLACLYIIIILTRQILETKLISGNLNVHPVVILISIYLGLKLFGIAGAILGPLAAASFKMIYEENVIRSR